MLKIGLTGGIASGKSTVADVFRSFGVPVIDADKIARNLFRDEAPLLDDLREHFGNKIFVENSLDRKALGKIVFNSPEELKWLNEFTHPHVSKKIQEELNSIKSPYIILDIPLLINKEGTIPNHLKRFIDRVLVINVPIETQIARIRNRDRLSQDDALAIINNQSSLEQKLSLANDVIENCGTIKELESNITKLHNKYLTLSK